MEKDSEKSKYFINKISISKNKAIKNKNNNYIIFLYKLSNSLLNSLIETQSQLDTEETEEKIEVFTPQVEFFDLYSELNKLVDTISIKVEPSVENNEILIKEKEKEKDNESENFVNKIYRLLMKELTESQNKEENNSKNRVILNLLKLFEISVNNDETKKNEILLLKDSNTKSSLFDLIYEKYISILSKKSGEKNNKNDSKELIPKSFEEEKQPELDNNNNNDNNTDSENDKFISLEEIKEPKKEDNSLTEELHKYYGELIYNIFKNSPSQSLIPKLIALINIFKKLSKKEK